jgi:hypothetical protein
MNLRANQPNLSRLRKVWYCICLGFTPALATRVGGQFWADSRRGPAPVEQSAPSRPYLTAIGPPALRFQEPVPANPPEATPASGAPPTPGLAQEHPDARTAGFPPPKAAAAPDRRAEGSQPAPTSETHSSGQPVGQDPSQPTILPDEMRPWVRPEEFLPFFQLPGSNGPGAPAPERVPPLPPSTATYKQQ